MSPEDRERVKLAGQAIEFLHAGSLIIDDVQDDSPVRRQDVSLHKRFGAAKAICAGNWLYFWPLRLIGKLGLSPENENIAFRAYNQTLEQGHYGQAIDISTKATELNQKDIVQLCWTTLYLKTGALTSLAMKLGALIAGTTPQHADAIGEIGNQFGVALQCYDDLGNILGKVDLEKRYEDLMLSKPSFVWAYAAEHYSQDEYLDFQRAIAKLPDDRPFRKWLEEHDFLSFARNEADRRLNVALNSASTVVPKDGTLATDKLHRLAQLLQEAYG